MTFTQLAEFFKTLDMDDDLARFIQAALVMRDALDYVSNQNYYEDETDPTVLRLVNKVRQALAKADDICKGMNDD